MTTYASPLRQKIEDRIPELIESSSASKLEHVPSARLMHGVVSQALTSARGGKRLRALLTLAAGQISGVDNSTLHRLEPDESTQSLDPTALLDVACAIEIFQTGALVHDDIIDDSDLRRGIPAAHRGLATIFSAFSHSLTSPTSSADTVGTGLGIMLGDLLATESLLVVNNATTGWSGSQAMTSTFLTMQREVEIGQIMDLADTAVNLNDSETMVENCLAVFRWKTASYTTIAPLELGFMSSGTDHETAHRWAERIGTPLGTAFQLADDLLDVHPGSHATGKPVGGDIREGKHTVLLADALTTATSSDKRALIRIFSTEKPSDDDVSQAITIFEKCGAIETSQNRIQKLWDSTQLQLRQWSAATGASDEQTELLHRACSDFLPTVHA